MDGATARSQKGSAGQPSPADTTTPQNPGGQPVEANAGGQQVDANVVGPDGLTRREHDILAFERQWWKYAGAKEEAIKELFGLSATRYYQVLNALVDRPEALAVDPMLVKRLRRLRASRQKARAARRLGFEIT